MQQDQLCLACYLGLIRLMSIYRMQYIHTNDLISRALLALNREFKNILRYIQNLKFFTIRKLAKMFTYRLYMNIYHMTGFPRLYSK